MCLSSIYVGEKTDENCIAEEVSRIEVNGDNVTLQTLFGESRSLQDHSISLMDSEENYVLLKKKIKKHSHEHKHEHGSVQGRLQTLLPYLITHNQSHAEDIDKWIKKTQEAGCREAADELKIAFDLFNKINDHFNKALSCLK
ncbi:MAG: CooT family nickel-binding protein [Chitinispirillia bacterium]|jgi:predicted RNA-binding protein